MKRSPLYFGVVALVGLSATGCAVTSGSIAEQADARTAVIAANQAAVAAAPLAPAPIKRIRGNFLGSQPLAMDHSQVLPAIMRDVTINAGSAKGDLRDVARVIRSNLGLSVRINADVGAPDKSAAPTPQASGTPMPPGRPGSGPLPASLPVTADLGARGDLPLSFKGDLADYLNRITGELGVSWEFVNNEIHIFRLLTRTFTLHISPGDVAFKDDVSTQGTSSSGGNAVAVQGGQFGSATQSSSTARYSPWDSVKETVATMVSKEGRFVVNQASATVVVTDTKPNVERIARWVESENAVLNRQVSIEVREIAVELNSGSQAGFDLGLIYSKLNAATGAPDWVFRFGAPSTLTDSSAGSAAVNIARADSRFAGSNVAVRALNSFGTIVLDQTRTVVTTNRVPGKLQDVTDRAYLAETTPASGGLTGTGSGVPGLKPGVVTYGDNLTVVPTIGENNSVLLQLFSTRSTLLSLDSVSSGNGQTFQQINTPVLGKRKNSQNFQMTQGETLVIVGNSAEAWNGRDQHSVSGASMNNTHKRTLSVLMVTPRILVGS